MMKRTGYILFWTLVVCIAGYGGFYFSPVKFYLMPVDAWGRKVWMGPDCTQKEENYVIYNYWGKSERMLTDSIIAFNDRTLRLDSVKKYPGGYRRSFFKRSGILTRYYREEEDGSDIIYDHFDKRILLFEWRIAGDTVYVEFLGKQGKVPLISADSGALSVSRQLELAGE